MRVWNIGHSLHGYLPEGDIYLTTSIDDAIETLRSDIDATVDFHYEGATIALDHKQYALDGETLARVREAIDNGDTTTLREVIADPGPGRDDVLEYADAVDALNVLDAMRADSDARYALESGRGLSFDIGPVRYYAIELDASDLHDDAREALEDEGRYVSPI